MDQPILKSIPPDKLELIREYYFDLKLIGMTGGIRVPEGFVWDGASIPRIFWITIGGPHDPRFVAAGLIHDYIYRTQRMPRSLADKIFYKILRLNGVGYINAKRMYFGVRVGGISAWNKHRKSLTH